MEWGVQIRLVVFRQMRVSHQLPERGLQHLRPRKIHRLVRLTNLELGPQILSRSSLRLLNKSPESVIPEIAEAATIGELRVKVARVEDRCLTVKVHLVCKG
jgi:hypothetical protein